MKMKLRSAARWGRRWVQRMVRRLPFGASSHSVDNCGVCISKVTVNFTAREYSVGVPVAQVRSDKLVAALRERERCPVRGALS